MKLERDYRRFESHVLRETGDTDLLRESVSRTVPNSLREETEETKWKERKKEVQGIHLLLKAFRENVSASYPPVLLSALNRAGIRGIVAQTSLPAAHPRHKFPARATRTLPRVMLALLFTMLLPPISLSLTTHVLTGPAGYICKETIHHILSSRPSSDLVVGLCRAGRVQSEAEYWRGISDRVQIRDVEEPEYPDSFTLYLLASNFSPGSETAKATENIRAVRDAVEALDPRSCQGCVLLSSMAAVRGPGQVPGPAGVFTSDDWNTVSELREGEFGQSYQYSKVRRFITLRTHFFRHIKRRRLFNKRTHTPHTPPSAPRSVVISFLRGVAGQTRQEKAFALACDSSNLPYASVCPSLVLGPLRSPTQYGTSLKMLSSWYSGKESCESRLMVDVRDVATAVVNAGDLVREGVTRGRYIVSHARRRTGAEILGVLNGKGGEGRGEGGEVEGDEVRDDSWRLGVELRGWEETIADTVESLKAVNIDI